MRWAMRDLTRSGASTAAQLNPRPRACETYNRHAWTLASARLVYSGGGYRAAFDEREPANDSRRSAIFAAHANLHRPEGQQLENRAGD
jgi:hypothetical protein